MQTYAILRRNTWPSPQDLETAAGRSTAVGEEMEEDVRWIRSYVLSEEDGSLGSVCIYEATSPEAIRRHGEKSEIAVDEILPVGDTVIVRPDPQGDAAAD